MKLLHVTNHYHPFTRGGGVERYIDRLATHCASVGDDVSVTARSTDDRRTAYRIAASSPRRLLRSIREADCLHLHGPRTAYAALAGVFAVLTRTPFVYTTHCFYRGKTRRQSCSKFLWDHLVERFLLHFASYVIVLSIPWHHYVGSRRLPTRKLRILPNGIDTQALRDESFTPITLAGNPAMLSVSRLDPVKRLEDAMAALTEPGMEHAHLHLVGSGVDESRLRTIADTHSVTDRITFHGFKSDADIAAMARAAHVFILASAEEGMPTTLLEMLARGLPVAASDIPGNRALLDALSWPHLHPLGDAKALAKCVIAARDAKVGDTHHTTLTTLFDWSAIAPAMRRYYQA